MKFSLSFIFCISLCFQTIAQDQNYLFTNASYAFFGTGDLSGTAIGLDYHRTLFSRFGIHLGFSKATGKGSGTLDRIGSNNRPLVTNLSFDGNADQTSDLANYNTYLLGVNYKVADGQKHTLLVAGGLNYKQLQYNYLSGFIAENVNGQGQAESITVLGSNLVAEKETGFYVNLDYLYAFENNLTLGLHFSVENSSNILSKTGISLGFRF